MSPIIPTTNRTDKGPATFAGVPLDHFNHVCAFLSGTNEERRLFDDFIEEGLSEGDKVSYIVNPADIKFTIDHFESFGIDMQRLLQNGDFEVHSWDQAHLRDGTFNADAMLALAENTMRASAPRRIRMVSDMEWAVNFQSKELIGYEARANVLMAGYDHIVICMYDISRFAGDIIVDVLRTHPMVLIGGILHVNPFYVPPEQMLNELGLTGEVPTPAH